MAESIKEGICRGNFRFAPSEKDLEVQIKVTSYLIQNSPCERTKNISDCRGVVRQLSKIKGPLQSASIARCFKIFGSCTYKKVLATLCDERDQKKIG